MKKKNWQTSKIIIDIDYIWSCFDLFNLELQVFLDNSIELAAPPGNEH